MKLIVGNWKMNGMLADTRERIEKLLSGVKETENPPFKMVVCPTATMLGLVSDLLEESDILWGGQDCHTESSGAFTGNISAEMLKDLKSSYVIVGHSERRQFHQETDEIVAKKAKAAHAAGLIPIICVGETDEERTNGKAEEVVSRQLAASIPDTATAENTVVAYEPIWAIGTGKTASKEDVEQIHSIIRAKVSEKVKKAAWLPLLYGGSVKPGNAEEILHAANVDGVLVGGASLKPDDFLSIARASKK